MFEGNYKYNLKLINGEIQVVIEQEAPYFINYKCKYRIVLNNHEIQGEFTMDSYSSESIYSKLQEELANKIALDLSFEFIKKQDPKVQEIYLKELNG